MEENKNIEENKDQLIADHSSFLEKPEDENSIDAGQPLNDLTPSNETMEVHKHPHHVMHKKKWGEYLLEFSMLFLAVFLGFLAENFREHQVEKEKEKQFIESFIEDLKTDTATIRKNLVFRDLKGKQLDSLTALLSSQTVKGHENDLYFLGRSLIRTSRFQSNDRTIMQLKNSGALRLIRSRQAADSMMSYQKFVEYMEVNQDDDRIERRAADPLLSRIFNVFVFDKMVTLDGISRPADNPALRSYDPDLFQDLAFCIHQIKGSNFLIKSRLRILNKKADDLIALLKKEYHLD
ncbi:MAG: hypothetical protein IPP96_15085 [Chitinophagaceae bacterium]|nr:hypothetical protein [Chitinophagaceae bacterium]